MMLGLQGRHLFYVDRIFENLNLYVLLDQPTNNLITIAEKRKDAIVNSFHLKEKSDDKFGRYF